MSSPMPVAPVTNAVAELRQRLLEILSSRGLSKKDLADMIGIPDSSFRRFLSDAGYASAELVERASAWLDRQDHPEDNQVEVTAEGFVKTAAALEIEGAFLIAKQQRKLTVVAGYPGIGKTHTATQLAAKVADTVLVRANPNMSCAGLAIQIGRQLGLDLRNGQSLDYMIDSIVAELRRRPEVVIIIDETDYLVSKTSLRKIEILRTILDEAKCGMMLLGMPRLLDSLTAGPNMRDNLSQLYSRVAFLRVLGALTEQEVRAFLRQWDITSDAFMILYKASSNLQRGNLRRLDHLVRNAALLADGGTITAKYVRDAMQDLELTRN